MVTRTPRLIRVDIEAECSQVKRIDEGVDHAHGVVLADVVVNRFRQKRRLGPIRAFDEPLHVSPRS